MKDYEKTDLIAEEALLKSPKKARQKVISTINDYIDDFEDMIAKIRMKHDKCLPLARAMGSEISDEILDKSKKDLEKILRRYRSLTIGKLEELKEQAEDIKNPLKAEAESKELLDRADEIHDERYPEFKDFLDKYKPIWVKDIAKEAIETASEVVGDEVETDGMSMTAEAASKISEKIADIRSARPKFEDAKKSVKSSILAKYSKALNRQRIDGFWAGINRANNSAKNTDGETYNRLKQGSTKLKPVLEKVENYHKKCVEELNSVFSKITFDKFRKAKAEDVSSWIKEAVKAEFEEQNLTSIEENVAEIRRLVEEAEDSWATEGRPMSQALHKVRKDNEAKQKQEKEEKKKLSEEAANAKLRADKEKEEKLAPYRARRAKENSAEYQAKLNEFLEEFNEKVKRGEAKPNDQPKYFKEWRAQQLATASFTEGCDDFDDAMEAVETGDIVAFVGGAILGSVLFNGLISKKEDVTDRSIHGAKAYRFLLNDDFVKAEKTMKKMLGSGKTFEVNKMVAREIHSFKNEYYRPVAYTINKFLDYYDRIKPELFKEKKYYFDSPNTVRDEAIYKRISNWKSEFYASSTTDMMEKAREISEYNPAYDMGTDCEVIRVDAKFLNDLLNVDKTFAILKVIDEALGNLPDPLRISLYDEHNRALAKYHLPVNPRETSIGEASSPLHAYIMFEYLIAERMTKIRDLFIQYISVVYDVLNYTRYLDKK